MGGDVVLAGYLQKLLGRCLTGDVSEQILPVFWGGGANGKSVLIRVVGHVLGDYAHSGAPQLLLAGASERHLTELAALHGRRFVACSETPEGKFFDESRIKELTGGDVITCRRMREDHWSYSPSAKLFLITNHKPRVRGNDHAIWRRLRLVPFEQTVADEERDPKLADKLIAEASGIVNWLARGCAAWLRDGMCEPARVVAATSEYRAEQDAVARFIDEACEKGPGKSVKASYLLDRYNAWARTRGEVALAQSELAQRLGQLGYASKRRAEGVCWLGFEVTADMPLNSFFSRGYQ
jgi:putative DNA primase/helicase